MLHQKNYLTQKLTPSKCALMCPNHICQPSKGLPVHSRVATLGFISVMSENLNFQIISYNISSYIILMDFF